MTRAERLAALRAHILASGARELVYRSEWLGYLPYGRYQWLEVADRDVVGLPPGWERADLDVLVTEGFLEVAGETRGADPDDVRILYHVVGGTR